MENLQQLPNEKEMNAPVEINREDRIEPDEKEQNERKDRPVPIDREKVPVPITDPIYEENNRQINENPNAPQMNV